MSEARSIDEILRNPASTAEVQRAVDVFVRRTWAQKPRVHILRNFTVETALPALRYAGYRREVALETSLSGFDAYRQDALVHGGDASKADFLIAWLWLELMPMAWDADRTLLGDFASRELFGLIDDLRSRSKAPILVHTFLPPLGAGAHWTGHDALDAVNRRIRERVRADPSLVLVDVARIASQLGYDAAIDARFSLMHDAPIAPALARAWGDAVAQIVASRVGRVRKVLVVDADETLWGGIVGEDGIGGIRLSSSGYPGNAYTAFQRQLLALRARGVLLALASKNDPESVFEVLDRHPSSLLHREHFAAMRIGWGAKSESIRAMAEELGLGLDAFVFVDDSPVECAEVAAALPMVEVIRMPREAHRVPSVLAGVTFFDAPAATVEDTLRAQHYEHERARTEARAQYPDLDSFLASLELDVTVGPPTEGEIARVAQLTQRTNQWNLTTPRYDEATISMMQAYEGFELVAMRVRDRYGDYGLTGLAIAAFDDAGNARIDALLMSCRTLGRKLEEVLLGELVQRIRDRNPGAVIHAHYRPTPKNGQVARFFDTHGFTPIGAPSADAEARSYVLANDAAFPPPGFIRIRRAP